MRPALVFDIARPVEAAEVFHRDGFVLVRDAITAHQLHRARARANCIIESEVPETCLADANRGFGRYSLGSQLHHAEFVNLADNPRILRILELIWNSSKFILAGIGMHLAMPGAPAQRLHADLHKVIVDPLGLTTDRDLPTPLAFVNYAMVDLTIRNGATRFVCATHRHRFDRGENRVFSGEHVIACAPAGAAMIFDARCWHAGTANVSDRPRCMVTFGYSAPWFRDANMMQMLPLSLYRTLSHRGKELTRFLVAIDDGPS